MSSTAVADGCIVRSTTAGRRSTMTSWRPSTANGSPLVPDATAAMAGSVVSIAPATGKLYRDEVISSPNGCVCRFRHLRRQLHDSALRQGGAEHRRQLRGAG